MTRTIYLDNAATTRVAPSVQEVVRECMDADYGNPSSAHHKGISAERRVTEARRSLGRAVGDPGGEQGEIIFTSGGTEADALGIMGPARARQKRGLSRIVLSAVEHPAVLESARLMEREGFTVHVVPVAKRGDVDPSVFLAAVNNETAVCALMLVQNEIGTIMPVAQIAHEIRNKHPHVHIHTDAVQGLGKVSLDVTQLAVDSAAFAAHKIHGPKGVGALWVRKGARLTPLWNGGGQQGGTRSGTLNVPGIAAFGRASELAVDGLDERATQYRGFAEIIRAHLGRAGIAFEENGSDAPRSPHVISLAFRGIPAEPLLHVLESRGVLVSAGSACSERDRKPSRVLTAIGLDKDFGTLRVSFGTDNSPDEIEEAARVLTASIKSFR